MTDISLNLPWKFKIKEIKVLVVVIGVWDLKDH